MQTIYAKKTIQYSQYSLNSFHDFFNAAHSKPTKSCRILRVMTSLKTTTSIKNGFYEHFGNLNNFRRNGKKKYRNRWTENETESSRFI